VEVDAPASLAARGGRDRDVDWALERIEELPEDRSGGMAEDSALAAGENGGHEVPMEAKAPVPYGVDALVDAVEATSLSTLSRRFASNPDAFQLPQSDHTVLPGGNLVQPSIGSVAFVADKETKATGPWTLPPTCLFFALLGALGDAKRPW
jgi:hypothetical protein